MFKLALIMGVFAVGALVLPEPAAASYLRCGNHIIEDGGRRGPGKYEVLQKCGEPTGRFGDTWIYDRAGEKVVLRFDPAGMLSRINRE